MKITALLTAALAGSVAASPFSWYTYTTTDVQRMKRQEGTSEVVPMLEQLLKDIKEQTKTMNDTIDGLDDDASVLDKASATEKIWDAMKKIIDLINQSGDSFKEMKNKGGDSEGDEEEEEGDVLAGQTGDNQLPTPEPKKLKVRQDDGDEDEEEGGRGGGRGGGRDEDEDEDEEDEEEEDAPEDEEDEGGDEEESGDDESGDDEEESDTPAEGEEGEDESGDGETDVPEEGGDEESGDDEEESGEDSGSGDSSEADKAKDLFGEILQELSGSLDKVIKKLGLGALLGFINPLGTSLSRVVDELKDLVDELLKLVKQLLDGILSGLSDALKGINLGDL